MGGEGWEKFGPPPMAPWRLRSAVGATWEVGVGGEVGGAGGGVGGVEVEERWRGVQVGGLRRQGGYCTSGRHSREATAQ